MKWMITFSKGKAWQGVAEQLHKLGCRVPTGLQPTSLSAEENVVSVEGPADLARRAESLKDTLRVYPNSKMEAY